eukprot:3188122-Rhodomonas_salina.1
MRCGAGLPLIRAALLPFMPRRHGPPLSPVSPDSTVCESGSWEQARHTFFWTQAPVSRTFYYESWSLLTGAQQSVSRALLLELCSEHEQTCQRNRIVQQ